MTTTHRSRQPQGTPVGGQFAQRENPEPDFDLDDIQEIVVNAKQFGSMLAWRYGVDADDLTQESLLSFVSAVRKNGRGNIANPGGYIATSARRAAVMAVYGSDGATRSALVVLRDRRAEIAQSIGRDLTQAEIEELAEEIRTSAPAGRRPREGFHRKTKFVPLDAVEEPVDSPPTQDADFADGSFGAMADDLAQKGKGHKVEAKRLAWRAIAEGAGAPYAATGTLNWRHTSHARKVVAEAGGASAVAARWERSHESSAESDALFIPFGDIDEAGKEKVCDILVRYQSHAENLWFVALGEAGSSAA